ncbi:MAG TPA: hypothetical protein VNW30_06735 [Opitutaceae bacterium]|nr:hypothetical protein [Opitutaceae bacterium]
MRLIRLFAFACFAVGGIFSCAHGAERNLWPFWVEEKNAAGQVTEWQGMGPLVFEKNTDDGRAGGFRPFYVWKKNAAGETTDASVAYPLFTYRAGPGGSSWSVFSMINCASPRPGTPDKNHSLDLWPFYFSRRTGDPASSYRAVFPLYGTVKNRLVDEWSWILFPLYGRFVKNNVATTTAPWPFVRTTRGEGNRGFALWPLFGWRAKDGAYHEQYYLWPFFAQSEHALWLPQPEVKLAVLPFYTREQATGSISENYFWPFFGYTDQAAPFRFHETRYFWPFLVQGRGDDHYYNRWAPFYTHSMVKGRDKTWVLWPLWRQIRWNAAGLAQTKTNGLIFLYWSLTEHSLAHPQLPPARRTSLWPLITVWDNGAGRRQVQVPSPFESYFPTNETMRLVYNPLSALYRYDRRTPGTVRQDFLFSFITYQRAPGHSEFHFGPFFKVQKDPGTTHVSFLSGLLGLRHNLDRPGWRPFAFDFSAKPLNPQVTSR